MAVSHPRLPANTQDIEALSSEKGTYFTRERFLEFGKPGQMVPSMIGYLASVVRHFVPLVADNGNCPWKSLTNQDPIPNYATASDLAFTFLVFEQYISWWKVLASHRRNTGKDMTGFAPPSMLHYNGGIAGKDAKARFNSLQVYFYTNFFTASAAANMAELQLAVNKIGIPDPAAHLLNQRRHKLDVIATEILHRVFYRVHVSY